MHRNRNLSALWAALVLLAALAASPASAAYDEKCWAQFRLPWWNGWSETFEVVCTYATGRELNERAGRQRFASYKQYVIINGAYVAQTTVRISQSLSCGFVAESPCAEQISHLLTGRDEFSYWRHGREYRREWAICQPGVLGECSSRVFRDRWR